MGSTGDLSDVSSVDETWCPDPPGSMGRNCLYLALFVSGASILYFCVPVCASTLALVAKWCTSLTSRVTLPTKPHRDFPSPAPHFDGPITTTRIDKKTNTVQRPTSTIQGSSTAVASTLTTTQWPTTNRAQVPQTTKYIEVRPALLRGSIYFGYLDVPQGTGLCTHFFESGFKEAIATGARSSSAHDGVTGIADYRKSNITSVKVVGCDQALENGVVASQEVRYMINVSDGIDGVALKTALDDTPMAFTQRFVEQLQSCTGVAVDDVKIGDLEIEWQGLCMKRKRIHGLTSLLTGLTLLLRSTSASG